MTAPPPAAGQAPGRGPAAVPTLAVVLVSHNGRDDLDRCLAGLLRPPPATPCQVAVVDNASTDGTRELVAGRWPNVLLLENPRNEGFARAVNQAVRATASELVLLLNPDTLITGAAVDELVAELARDPAVAAAGPRIVDRDGRPEISWGRHPGPWTDFRRSRLSRAYDDGADWARRRVERLARRRRDVDWLTGACLLARRSALLAAGLMDERYFLYLEDVDLCAALRERGGRVRFIPGVEITHLRGRALSHLPEQRVAERRRSQLAFYRKHHPLWYPLLRLYRRLTAGGV